MLWPPNHWYTLPPKQAKIVLKSVFLNKINTLSVVILWLPTFWSSKILWPPYFSFQKFKTPPQYIWEPPHSEENDIPLIDYNIISTAAFTSKVWKKYTSGGRYWNMCINQFLNDSQNCLPVPDTMYAQNRHWAHLVSQLQCATYATWSRGMSHMSEIFNFDFSM